jgi:hypothetical protein
LVKKFRVKFGQVSKIGFKVFNLGFGKRAVSFGKVIFSGLRFVGSSQALKIGSIFSAKVLASLVRAFLVELVCSGKVAFSQSQFLA